MDSYQQIIDATIAAWKIRHPEHHVDRVIYRGSGGLSCNAYVCVDAKDAFGNPYRIDKQFDFGSTVKDLIEWIMQ